MQNRLSEGKLRSAGFRFVSLHDAQRGAVWRGGPAQKQDSPLAPTPLATVLTFEPPWRERAVTRGPESSRPTPAALPSPGRVSYSYTNSCPRKIPHVCSPAPSLDTGGDSATPTADQLSHQLTTATTTEHEWTVWSQTPTRHPWRPREGTRKREDHE